MCELKWEQNDLDVLIKDNNEATVISLLELREPTNKFINIALEDANGINFGTFTLNSSVGLESLEKVFKCVNFQCEILKQEKIKGYKPKFKIAKYNTETKQYEA